MAKAMYYGSIDVTKISKEKLVDGKKGKYCSVVVWINDEEDRFGNIASIQEGQSKEERESGAAKIYLGNLKQGGASQSSAPAKGLGVKDEDNVLPF